MAAKLNDEQFKFVHYLLEGLTNHEAYCRAYGYEYEKLSAKQKSSIRGRANKLAEKQNISDLLKQHRQRLIEVSDIKKEDILKLLYRVISGENVTDRTVTAESDTNGKTTTTHSMSVQWAIEKLCKLLGLNEAEKHELTFGQEATREELEQELKRLEALQL